MMSIMLIASATMGVEAQQLKSGIDITNLNQTVKPGNDFYQYACGGWMKKNPLPAAYSRFGSFDQLQEDNNKRINTILKDLTSGKKKYQKGSVEQKLGDFYKLAMDQKRRNREGVAPVLPYLKELEQAATKDDLFAVQQRLLQYGDQEFMRFGFGADEKDSKNNILNVSQGGIALGQKEYYLDTDSITTSIRDAYRSHIYRMFRLFGYDEMRAKEKMDQVMRVETALAKVSKSRTELRDVEANYNKMTMQEFQRNYPHLRLAQQMETLGVKADDYRELVVGQPDFLAGAEQLVKSMSAGEYRAYMQWGVILGASSYLSEEIAAANFDFFGKTLRGRQEDYPLWKRATQQVESQMGEALGKIYCERYFPATSKQRMEQLVKNLQVALGERIEAQTWMSAETKRAALDKLSTFYVKIGYPNKWKDMSGLDIDPKKTYFENVMECNRFWTAKEIEEKAGKPVDNDEWYMTPQTVNAYYNPTTNEICFPAGILQKPFFDPDADIPVNYGAIGVVIGHEMSHGFDDQGSMFDAKGNMSNWWTAEDKAKFDAKGDALAAQFDAVEVLPGLMANGRYTLGENIGDHGGLSFAFSAMQNALKDHPQGLVDGLTPEQRFYLSYANVWAANITDEEKARRTNMDVHSLGVNRVNVSIRNFDSFFKAFDIKEGDPMFRPEEERVHIW